MRSSVAPRFALVLCALLGACGRFGFSDAPTDAAIDDAADGTDATDGAMQDAAPDAVDIVVFDREKNKTTPVAGSMVFIDDGTSTQMLTPDAAGKVHASVSGQVTIHVAVPYSGSRWRIVTYEDIPAGTSLLVGPSAEFELGTNRTMAVAVVPNTNLYGTSVPTECGSGGGSSGNQEFFRSYAACDGLSIPIVVAAADSANNILGILHTTVVPSSTTTISTPFSAPQTREIEFPTNPLLSFFSTTVDTREGARWLNTMARVTGQASNVATIATTDQTIDRVRVYWGTGTHTHELQTPVDPAVGIRSTVPPERDTYTIASITRTGDGTISWTYALSQLVHPGSFLAMHEQYGSVDHIYIVDPSRRSITRPRLPAPLDTLYDGANVKGTYALLFQVDEQTFAQSLYNAELLSSGYEAQNDYFVRENLLVNQ